MVGARKYEPRSSATQDADRSTAGPGSDLSLSAHFIPRTPDRGLSRPRSPVGNQHIGFGRSLRPSPGANNFVPAFSSGQGSQDRIFRWHTRGDDQAQGFQGRRHYTGQALHPFRYRCAAHRQSQRAVPHLHRHRNVFGTHVTNRCERVSGNCRRNFSTRCAHSSCNCVHAHPPCHLLGPVLAPSTTHFHSHRAPKKKYQEL